MRHLSFFLFFVLIVTSAGAQFSDDFSGTLELWNGDILDFTINENQELQLNAQEAGQSIIKSSATFPENWECSLDIELDFNPSNSNSLKWLVAMKNEDFDTADGLWVEMGETGSGDAIYIYSRINGVEEMLGQGTIGGVAEAPSINIKFQNLADQGLIMTVDYTGETIFQEEYRGPALGSLSGNLFFGMECNYTSSRSNLFFFDNYMVKVFEEDTSPPVLIDAFVNENGMIILQFDERINATNALNVDNYRISTNGEMPSSVTIEGNRVVLEFEDLPLSLFTLEIIEIEDLKGNASSSIITEELFITFRPIEGDLKLTEVLFDPFSGEFDFVEVYNDSEKILNLDGLTIENQDNGRSETLELFFPLFPGEYVAISESEENLRQRYLPPGDALILENELPSFNNDAGNVSLVINGSILESFDYEDGFHNPILNNIEGISLERIDLASDVNDPNNWTSSSSTANFATPGYQNSAFLQPASTNEVISLRTKSFSPNGDGNNDFLILDYNLDKSNYIANIKVFSDTGQEIAIIAEGESLASSGFLRWDGNDLDGNPVRIGIYIIYMNLFHADGERISEKFSAVVNRPF